VSGAWEILAGAIGVGLVALEWRRAERARRWARVTAAALAVGALGALRWQSAVRSEGPTRAVLWTESATGGGSVVAAGARALALPGVSEAPQEAEVIPDVGYLRRTWPEIAELEIRGDGLEREEWARLAGVKVSFKGTDGPAGGPRLTAIEAPTRVAPGEAWTLRGRVSGVAAEKSVVVTLEQPDGAVLARTWAATREGRVEFEIPVAGAPTVGRFVWHLRLAAGEAPEKFLADEVIGVAVAAPELARVLVLEGAPRMDTARLRTWFTAQGGQLTSRTLISAERFRFAGSASEVAEFKTVETGLLAGYDVVVTDGAAWGGLAEAERAALREAVAAQGLGVVFLADDALVAAVRGGETATRDEFLQPWRLRPVGEGEAASGARRVRLQGPPGGVVPAEPVAAAPFEITVGAGSAAWLRDGQRRVVVAGSPRGRGQVALSLVQDTWRWRQGERPAAFADYWSWLLAQVARPAEANARGRWTLVTELPTVDRRVRLRWTGRADGMAPPATVRAEGDAGATTLALAQDRIESARWGADFWPRRAGWHRVTGAGGAVLDFWVNAADAWPGVRAQAKRDATAEVAAMRSAAEASRTAGGGVKRHGSAREWLALAVFLGGAGYLWWEGRQRRGR
jgi:hypothetical protein